jgi:PAS domain S-box-containing protein
MAGKVAVMLTDVTTRRQAETKARLASEETQRLLVESEQMKEVLVSSLKEKERTEKKLVAEEKKLIYEKQLLHTLMASQPDRIFFKDIDLRFIRVSNDLAKAFNLASPDDAIGKTEMDLNPSRETLEIMLAEREILHSGVPILSRSDSYTAPDKRIHWVSTSKVPFRDADGKIIGLIGISRDITQEMELQNRLQQSSKMDAIGRLVGGIAHDFNNNLQAILGFTELLKEETAEGSQQRDDLGQIEDAARRSSALTRQLLDFSRKSPGEKQPTNLNNVVQSVVKMLHTLIGENIQLTVSLADNIQPVMADAHQLENILVNLAVNAKAALAKEPDGHLTFQTRVVTMDQAAIRHIKDSRVGTFVSISITDNGCGIPKELQQRLFEPFFTTKPKGEGTGLGLFNCYGIVQQHNGWINVYSETETRDNASRGTTFKIYLPIGAAGSAALTGASAVPEPPAPEGRPMTILLVEDEPGVRSLAEAVLKKAGHTVLSCANATEAKDCFAREGAKITLLFSDIMLGGQNGLDLAVELRQRQPDLPVLLCSGYTDDTVRWSLIQKEGFHFLGKPYPTASLLTAVRDIFLPPTTPKPSGSAS